MNLKDIANIAPLLAGLAAGLVGYMIIPKDMTSFKEKLLAQKKKKTGILLLISPFLVTIGEFISGMQTPILDKYLKKISSILTSANMHETINSEEFSALQILTPLPFIPVYLLAVLRIDMFQAFRAPIMLVFGAVILSFITMFIPLIILTDKKNKRLKSISREIRFILYIITSSVQAGMDFSGAIRRILQKASKGSPFKDELTLMLKEISLGKTRSESLMRLALRVNLPELTTVINSLIQADQLGTSLGLVLTTLSDDLRIKRFQKAEKMALEAPVKMLFPLIAFIFPAVFIILIGPLILQIVESLGK